MIKSLCCFIGFVACMSVNHAQGFYFGPKGGLTIATQNWNSTERNPLLSFHAAAFIESIDVDYKGALFAQLGYHSRGSSISVIDINTGFRFNDGYKFRNLSLLLGAKKRIRTEKYTTPYYFFGIRVEYNIANNLGELQDGLGNSTSSLFYPLEPYVNKITYGASFGGGVEFLGSAYVQPALEFTVSPDLSYQYRSPVIPNVINPYNGMTTTIQERTIRNVSFEVCLMVRFLREVIYIE